MHGNGIGGVMMDNKWNIGEGGDMPIGFGLALAVNAKSMERFVNSLGAQFSGSATLRENEP